VVLLVFLLIINPTQTTVIQEILEQEEAAVAVHISGLELSKEQEQAAEVLLLEVLVVLDGF
jgi:hypothetical protein